MNEHKGNSNVKERKWRHRFRRLGSAVLVLLCLSSLTIWLCDRAVDRAAKGKLYSDAAKVPYNKVGLLLGTSKYLGSGKVNPYYRYRIEAAASLYKAGKVRYIVVSGDNSRKDYNEPEQMRADLVAQGLDSARIYSDYAGFRTFDSMVRVREIFGQDSVTVISQPFHNERALYIASHEGIAAVGFNAKDVGERFGLQVQLREKLARVKLFIDFVTGKQPKFLGEKITIPE